MALRPAPESQPQLCPHACTQSGCRVVANPLGYAHKGEQHPFNAQRVLQLQR